MNNVQACSRVKEACNGSGSFYKALRQTILVLSMLVQTMPLLLLSNCATARVVSAANNGAPSAEMDLFGFAKARSRALELCGNAKFLSRGNLVEARDQYEEAIKGYPNAKREPQCIEAREMLHY